MTEQMERVKHGIGKKNPFEYSKIKKTLSRLGLSNTGPVISELCSSNEFDFVKITIGFEMLSKDVVFGNNPENKGYELEQIISVGILHPGLWNHNNTFFLQIRSTMHTESFSFHTNVSHEMKFIRLMLF